MNYKVLFFTITLTILVMGSVLFFVVSAGAKQAQSTVLEEQEGRTLANPTVTKGTFSLGQPAFSDEQRSCEVPFRDYAYVNANFRYRFVPRSCDIFVNGRYERTARNLTPDCIGECPYGEFSRTLRLGFHDVREDHVVRVCCNDICVEENLRALCEPSGELETGPRG